MDIIEVTTEIVDIDSLEPHPENYNRHTDEGTERLASGIGKLGQVRPIIVKGNRIYAGHGVWMAAKRRGAKRISINRLPDDYPEDKARAFMVADNEQARHSQRDEVAMAEIIRELEQVDPNLAEATGWTTEELDAHLEEMATGIMIGGGHGGGGEIYDDGAGQPVIRIQVPVEVFQRYLEIMSQFSGGEVEQFSAMLEAAGNNLPPMWESEWQ